MVAKGVWCLSDVVLVGFVSCCGRVRLLGRIGGGSVKVGVRGLVCGGGRVLRLGRWW